MNKARRKAIEDIIDQLGMLKEQVESIIVEEQEAFDNMPTSIQYSARGDAMGDYINDLDDAESGIDDVMSTLQDIIDR